MSVIANEVTNPRGKANAPTWQIFANVGSVSKASVSVSGFGPAAAITNTDTAEVLVFYQVSVPCRARDVIFTSAKIKAGVGGIGVDLRFDFYTAEGGYIDTSDPIDANGFVEGVEYELKGFDTAPEGAAFVNAYAVALVNPTTFYVTDAQVTVAPWGDVGDFRCGDNTDWEWEGTADASRSTGPAEPTHPEFFGYSGISQVQVSPELTTEEYLRTAKQAGANAIRIPLNIADLDSPQPNEGDPIDWSGSRYVELLEECRAQNMKALLIATQVPTWLNDSGELTWRGLTRYAEYAAIFAPLLLEYRDVICGIEGYNESNLTFFWNYGWAVEQVPDAAQYVAVLGAIYEMVQNTAPEIPVIGGVLSHYQADSGFNVSQTTFLTQLIAAGLEDICDMVSVHPYPAIPTTPVSTPYLPGPRSGPATGGSFNGGIWRSLNQVRGLTDLPVVVSELGIFARYDTQEEIWQAMLALIRGMLARAGVAMVFVHELIRPDALNGTGWEIVRLPSHAFTGAAQTLAA